MTGFSDLLRKTYYFLKQEMAWRKKLRTFHRQFAEFRSRAAPGVVFSENPQLFDDTGSTPVEPHYTYHPAWAARVLANLRPAKHIDISSTTNFTTIVSAFIPIEFYDYRPAGIYLSNYSSGHADLTCLPFADSSVESLSCMHTVEHIGLGRYGDPLDVDGDQKAMKELARVLAKNGALLFVVPIGNPRIEFNAHRVYAYDTIVAAFSGLFLKEFTLIPDDAATQGYVTNPGRDLIDRQHWACGCFWFTKI